MRASPVSELMRPVSMAYRFCACWMSVADAFGKLAPTNIAVAASVGINPKFTVGTRVCCSSHTSACSIVPPKPMVCGPLIQVTLSSITFVDASRADCVVVPTPAVVPVVATPLARFVSANPVPQHAPARLSRYPPVPENIDGSSSGENKVEPPVPPTRNSLTRLAPNVDRSDSDVVQRVDCWLPVLGKPGNGTWALLVVSGVELMCR